MIVHEDVVGPIEANFDRHRCDLQMKKCEKYPMVTSSGICEILQDKKSIFYGMFSHFQPPLDCPIKAGKYIVPPTTIDLTIIQMLPSDGFYWISTIRLFSGRERKIALCIRTETKVTRARRPKNKLN